MSERVWAYFKKIDRIQSELGRVWHDVSWSVSSPMPVTIEYCEVPGVLDAGVFTADDGQKLPDGDWLFVALDAEPGLLERIVDPEPSAEKIAQWQKQMARIAKRIGRIMQRVEAKDER